MEQYSRLSMDAQEHQELIYALSKPLKERYSSRLDKTPRNFDTELKNACAGQQRNIFLGTGFQAWFAYFMTDPQTQTAVQQLSGPAAQSVARHLCMIKPHPSIEALFQHIFYKSNRARARCLPLENSGYSYPARQDEIASEEARPHSTSPSMTIDDDSDTLPAREQPHLPIDNAYPNILNSPSIGSIASQDIGLHSLNSTQGMGLPSFHAQGTQRSPPTRSEARTPIDIPQTRVSPEAKNIPMLFPRQTCASIVKSDREASIRAIFGEPLQCSLEVDIYSHKVPHIVKDLFGLHVEIEDGRLIMRFSTGASILITTLELSGADREGAERLLGTTFANISSDALYVQEFEGGESVTNLVSLEINGNVQGQSCLKIRCSARTLSSISARLWPSFP